MPMNINNSSVWKNKVYSHKHLIPIKVYSDTLLIPKGNINVLLFVYKHRGSLINHMAMHVD